MFEKSNFDSHFNSRVCSLLISEVTLNFGMEDVFLLTVLAVLPAHYLAGALQAVRC